MSEIGFAGSFDDKTVRVLLAVLYWDGPTGPSVRELCELLGISSTSQVHRRLVLLDNAGLVSWERDKKRTLQPTATVHAFS